MNLVLDAEGQHLRICDFGLARVVDDGGSQDPASQQNVAKYATMWQNVMKYQNVATRAHLSDILQYVWKCVTSATTPFVPNPSGSRWHPLLQDRPACRGGSARYMAPECHDGSVAPLTVKSDVWSCGCAPPSAVRGRSGGCLSSLSRGLKGMFRSP